jgi:hypothetical protein
MQGGLQGFQTRQAMLGEGDGRQVATAELPSQVTDGLKM